MSQCENYQINISAMIDGELRGAELTETVRHLAQCPDCLAQFERFQRLQDRLDAETAAIQAPVALWEQIERQTPQRTAKRISLKSVAYTTLRYAAVLAIAFVIGYTSHSTVIPFMQKDDPIVLASDQGNLSETQFLALTRDLLTADPIYHQKMYQILQTLSAEEWEGNVEPFEQADYTKDDGETFRF
ncbi:zf-HC2 domain-containing protein [bacterium]|nr:zf-HC2 domain-containing protein [bacterium]